MTISFTVNGQKRSVDTNPDRPLLDVIREEFDLTGTKYGCGEGKCRSCTVLLDGRPITSCETPVGKADGKTVVTIEGLAKDGRLNQVQQAFVDEGAMQCGYCVPGMVMTATALLASNPDPTDDQIVTFMNGNLCRCNGYPRILAAIRRACGRPDKVDSP